jgi:hypothetical protein
MAAVSVATGMKPPLSLLPIPESVSENTVGDRGQATMIVSDGWQVPHHPRATIMRILPPVAGLGIVRAGCTEAADKAIAVKPKMNEATQMTRKMRAGMVGICIFAGDREVRWVDFCLRKTTSYRDPRARHSTRPDREDSVLRRAMKSDTTDTVALNVHRASDLFATCTLLTCNCSSWHRHANGIFR